MQHTQHPRVLQLMADATGGIAGHVLSLTDGLNAAGWPTLIATTAASAAAMPPGARHVVVAWPGRGGSLAQLRRLIAGADIVHAHGHQAGSLAITVRAGLPRRRRPRLVVTWHNALLAGGPQRLAGAGMEVLQAVGADLLTGASSDLVTRAHRLGARHAELSEVAAPDLTPWPGGRAQAREEVADLGLAAGATWILTVSRIAPQKNLPVLVDAAAQVGRTGAVVWVVVGAGDPALEARLRDQVLTSGAPVRFVGARPDVPRLVAAADLLVLPSRWEARSLVVQEAMVGGLPCVVTDTGGLPDLVGDAGLVVPVDDATALASAVRRVLDEPGLAGTLGEQARHRAAAFPSPGDVVDAWVGRYERLLSR